MCTWAPPKPPEPEPEPEEDPDAFIPTTYLVDKNVSMSDDPNWSSFMRTGYPVEEVFPSNLLTHKLCNPCPRTIVHMVAYLGAGGGGKKGTPMPLALSTRKRIEIDECVKIRNAPTPCFVLKSTGFHYEGDPIARLLMRTSRSNGEMVVGGTRRRRLRRPPAEEQQQQRWPRVCEMKRCTGEAPAGGVPRFAGCRVLIWQL